MKRALFSWAGAAAVLAALAAVDAVTLAARARVDLSAGRVYSLSPATKAALSGLAQPLVVQVYFTSRLPPPFSLHERYLRDLLREYEAAGGRRVRVDWSDPGRDDAAKRRAADAGVTAVQINTTDRDRFEAKEAMMGVVLLYGGKSETLAVVGGPEDLEYELTRRVRRLASSGRKPVGFVTGHGEKSPDDAGLAAFFAAARDLVEPRAVSLSALPKDLAALWLVGPTAKLKPEELETLRAFARSGKTLVVLANRRLADFVSFQSSPVDAGLAPLLSGWGVSLGDKPVVDAQCERIQIQSRVGDFMAVRLVEYPFIPIATRLDETHPALAGLQAVPFAFAQAVRFDAAKASGASFAPLAQTSHSSWETEAPDLSPTRPLDRLRGESRGPFALAGLARGAQGKLVVVGTAYQLDSRLVAKPAVSAFLLNLLEWSADETALPSPRGKGLIYRPLRPLPPESRAALKYALLLALPAAALLGLAARQRSRRARLRELAALYADA